MSMQEVFEWIEDRVNNPVAQLVVFLLVALIRHYVRSRSAPPQETPPQPAKSQETT